MELLLAELVLGFAIGMALGLLGGGGSILTVPALVYVVGMPPQTAVTASLMIVGFNGLTGAFFHRSKGTLNWHVALLFGGVGMAAAYIAAGLSKQFSPTLLMVLFATLMLVVGSIMIRGAKKSHEIHEPRGLVAILASGIGVGLLTGFLGVGGGFLIVPALVLLVGLPMQKAVGTSLVIITMNSVAGFIGHMNNLSIDLTTVLVFAAAGAVGAFAGAHLAERVQPARLRQIFAIFVIGLAVFLLIDNLSKLFVS